jgi:cytochrome c5
MRTIETNQVTSVHDIIHATCDLCGAKAVSARPNSENDWSKSQFRIHDTTLVCRDGTNSPDGGSGSDIVVDLCNACFRSKLVPWLESQGAKIHERKWDW